MDVKPLVLIVEDEEAILNFISAVLSSNGYRIVKAVSGLEGLTLAASHAPDLVLLDLGLPDIDGMEVLARLRAWTKTPVVVVSARGREHEKVEALDQGADDYIVKPFDTKEVLARIKAVLRRTDKAPAEPAVKEVKYDKLIVNMTRYEMKVDGKVVDTPPKELELLYHLASNPNRVYTRDQLLDEVWGFEYYGDSRTVDVHIKRLREKLEGISPEWSLKTVWGVGYKFEVKE